MNRAQIDSCINNVTTDNKMGIKAMCQAWHKAFYDRHHLVIQLKSQQLQINSIAVSISLGFQNIAKVKHPGAKILSYVI